MTLTRYWIKFALLPTTDGTSSAVTATIFKNSQPLNWKYLSSSLYILCFAQCLMVTMNHKYKFTLYSHLNSKRRKLVLNVIWNWLLTGLFMFFFFFQKLLKHLCWENMNKLLLKNNKYWFNVLYEIICHLMQYCIFRRVY